MPIRPNIPSHTGLIWVREPAFAVWSRIPSDGADPRTSAIGGPGSAQPGDSSEPQYRHARAVERIASEQRGQGDRISAVATPSVVRSVIAHISAATQPSK